MRAAAVPPLGRAVEAVQRGGPVAVGASSGRWRGRPPLSRSQNGGRRQQRVRSGGDESGGGPGPCAASGAGYGEAAARRDGAVPFGPARRQPMLCPRCVSAARLSVPGAFWSPAAPTYSGRPGRAAPSCARRSPRRLPRRRRAVGLEAGQGAGGTAWSGRGLGGGEPALPRSGPAGKAGPPGADLGKGFVSCRLRQRLVRGVPAQVPCRNWACR